MLMILPSAQLHDLGEEFRCYVAPVFYDILAQALSFNTEK